MSAAPHRIDVHHHILPPEYVSALAGIGVSGAAGVPFPEWDVDRALGVMDRQGIATAIISISCPGVHFGEDLFTRDLARRCNEYSARLVSDRPQRFGAFATLTLPDVEGALIELEYALDTLKLDGVVLLASVDGRYLGDPDFEDLFHELDRRRAIVFVHPNIPPSSKSVKLDVSGSVVEFPFDTTRTILSLIHSGTLERYPKIRFILSHAGGTAPFLAWRLGLIQADPAVRERTPKGVLHYLQQLYYDTALSFAPYPLRALQELVEPSQILFGSDYMFAPEGITAASVAGLAEYDGFDASTRRGVERDNALELFPRLVLE